MGKFIVTDDKEKFTKSKCDCKMCKEMDSVNLEWSRFKPKNNLQRRMKKVVEKIEKRERMKNK